MKTSRPWTKKPELHPGWKMTPAQHRTYWNLLQRAHKAYGVGQRCDAALTFEDFRALIHVRAFGKNISAKDIDRMKGFDTFKATCMAIIQPDNLAGQVAIENMPRTRLIHRICNDFPASYILCLMNSPRFARCRQNEQRAGLEDLERWTEKDLTDLRTTLCARNPVQTDLSTGSAIVRPETDQPEKETRAAGNGDDQMPCDHPCDAYLEGRACRCAPEGAPPEPPEQWEKENLKEAETEDQPF